MNSIYRNLLALIFLATAACGPADRGEECYESSHGNRLCDDGLQCVFQPSEEKRICAAPGDESTACEVDEDCHGKHLSCFSKYCATQRNEDEACSVDRQCNGELVCAREYYAWNYGSRVCWPEEKANAMDQCMEACLDEYYESCSAACAQSDKTDAECDEQCTLTRPTPTWFTETSNCHYECYPSQETTEP